MSKIFIADDEPEVLELCKTILEREKHTVVSINNGTRLLDQLKKEKPDLLLLDVMLPGIDGYTLQLQISQEPLLANIPIIIVSALQPAKKLFEPFKQVKAFLPKPFVMNALIEEVNRALKIFS